MAKKSKYVKGTIGDQSTEALIARHKTKLSSEMSMRDMVDKISESIGRKSKYTKRRAIDCKLVSQSKTNPGYCKYMITIAEMDGTIHKQPAYGKDMQGALSRLIKKELTIKVERKLETSPGFVFLLWISVMTIPLAFGDSSSPWFLAYTFGSVFALIGLAVLWYNHIKKGEENV